MKTQLPSKKLSFEPISIIYLPTYESGFFLFSLYCPRTEVQLMLPALFCRLVIFHMTSPLRSVCSRACSRACSLLLVLSVRSRLEVRGAYSRCGGRCNVMSRYLLIHSPSPCSCPPGSSSPLSRWAAAASQDTSAFTPPCGVHAPRRRKTHPANETAHSCPCSKQARKQPPPKGRGLRLLTPVLFEPCSRLCRVVTSNL